MIFPGKFIPKRASNGEHNFLLYAPPQLLALIVLGLFAPGGLLEYAISKGRIAVGVIGLLVWVPILWLLLVKIHQAGRVRILLSAPIVLVGHLLIANWFAASL